MISKNDNLSYLGVSLATLRFASGRAASGFTSFQQSFSLCSKAVPSPSLPSRLTLGFVLFFYLFAYQTLQAQFPPQAGLPGSTAIHKDSAIFVGWAKQCQVFRGYIDIQNPSQGLASVGSEQNVIGIADNAVVSLGDSGFAIVTFDYPIQNQPGPDFAVFENGFINANGAFLELAHVEVSSDGIHFVRFPSISLTDTLSQVGGFGVLDASKIHNLAGKYLLNYGTPFDLEDLKDSSNLNINHITHVKVVDVIGSISPLYRSYDSQGRPINDPYPTPFASSGFDLDAIGVIHWNTQVAREQSYQQATIQVFPTYFHTHQKKTLHFQTEQPLTKIEIFSLEGQLLLAIKPLPSEKNYSIDFLPQGLFLVVAHTETTVSTHKIIIAE
jgi:hypothetical protein